MEAHDVLVIGAGISGASFAFHAACAGRRVLVLEQEQRVGGCLASQRTRWGFWYELGAHTCYNSYGAFIELLESSNLMGELQKSLKKTILLVTHDPRAAERAQRIVQLEKGQLIEGTPLPGERPKAPQETGIRPT